jgi:hypothetical protein
MFKSTDVLAYERVISLQVAVSRSTGLVLINANYQPQLALSTEMARLLSHDLLKFADMSVHVSNQQSR